MHIPLKACTIMVFKLPIYASSDLFSFCLRVQIHGGFDRWRLSSSRDEQLRLPAMDSMEKRASSVREPLYHEPKTSVSATSLSAYY